MRELIHGIYQDRLRPIKTMVLSMLLTKTARNVIFLFLTSAVAFLQMVYQLKLPGPYYDEAAHSVYAIWLLTGRPVLWGPPFAYDALGVPILGSTGYYVGPFESYLSLLSMSLLGINVIALRLPPIFFAIATLPFVFFFTKNLFGEISAFVTTLLLAIQPSLILWSRVGLYPFSIVVFFICSSLYMFQRWLWTRKTSWLVMGTFLLGLGFETFITFVWYIVALVTAVLIMRINTHIRKRQIFLMTASFLAGVGPYLIPWLSGENISFFTRHAAVSYAGVNNLMYVDNLILRLYHLRVLLEGSGFYHIYGETRFSSPLATSLLGASLLGIVLLVALLKRAQGKGSKRHLFLTALLTVILLQTPITISSLNPYQLLPLIPFSMMIIGSFVGSVWELDKVLRKSFHNPKTRSLLKSCKVVLLLFLCSSVLMDLSTTMGYHNDLRQSGGVGRWNSAIYDAANYLVSANCNHILAGDWGLSYSLLVASGGKLDVRDIFWTQGEAFKNAASQYLGTPNVCYVFWINPTIWSRLPLLQEVVSSKGKSLSLEKTLYQSDGIPSIDIYRIAE